MTSIECHLARNGSAVRKNNSEMAEDVENGNGTVKQDCEKRTVEVCVLFVKLGEIDTIREQFSADVLIKCKWREPRLDDVSSVSDLSSAIIKSEYWDPKIFVENTIGECKETISHQIALNAKGEAYVCENRRIRGSFVENLELDDFPFDVQDLSVIVASERYTDEVDFANDPSDMHRVCKRSFVDEQEWCLYKHIEVVKDEYSDDMLVGDSNHKKPMFLVRCRAARRPWYFLVNMYSFTFLTVGLSFATFSVDWDKPENRLQLSFTLLLTSVAFKLVINQTLPKISYMTFLDQYTYVSTLVMVFICIWHAFSSLLSRDIAVGVQNVALGVFVSCYAIYNITYAFYIYITVYKKRRQLTTKDVEYLQQMRKVQDQQSLRRELQNVTSTFMTLELNLARAPSAESDKRFGRGRSQEKITPESTVLDPEVVTIRL